MRAVQRHIRMSPQKVRLVLDVVRGKNAREALAILKFLPNRAARTVAAAVRSAVANAENNFNMDPEELVITRCAADEGRTLKRWRPRARGRVTGEQPTRRQRLVVGMGEHGEQAL